MSRSTQTPKNLPTEIWDIIFDYKNAMETKEKHNALTKALIGEINGCVADRRIADAFQDEGYHFTNDIWWWMTEDGEKVMRPEIRQCSCGGYDEDFEDGDCNECH
tara:strand:- start:298 stop:612 length:315 start_codon:yes stop_codon:yes gene_type:complete